MKSNLIFYDEMSSKQQIAVGKLSSDDRNYAFYAQALRILVLLAAGVCFVLQANAQEYQFKVLANQGDNTLITSDQSRKEYLKVGTILQEGDKLILGEGAYVGLMHPNGRTLELKTAGVFEVSALAKQAGEGSSVAGKYASFIMSKMEESETNINENHAQHLKVTGAVERAMDSFAIKVMMPNAAKIFSTEALLKWNDLGADTYVVTVKNMYDEVLFTQEAKNAQIKLDLNENRLASEKLVIVKVSVKDNPALASDNYGIKKMDQQKSKAINADLAALKSSFQEENALNKLILASFYEQHDLLVDALASYEEAIAINPTVKEYKVAYEQFVSRNNLLN